MSVCDGIAGSIEPHWRFQCLQQTHDMSELASSGVLGTLPYINQDTVCDAYQCHEEVLRVAARICKRWGHTDSQKAVLRARNEQALSVSQKVAGITFAANIDMPALSGPPKTYIRKDAPR